MPRPRQLDPASLTLRLQAQGPLSAQAMAAAAGVDRSRVSRALTALGPAIIRLGTTRGATYGLRRAIRGLGDTFALRRIDTQGRAHDWAELTALHGGWRITWADAARAPAWADHLLALGGFCEGFPFFLGELRPQGFLGRAIGRALPPALGLAPDPRSWPSDDDTLVYLVSEGDDLPGDLIAGDAPLVRFQESLLAPAAELLTETDRQTRYPALAAAAAAPGAGGSSVEGEQPKFLATLAPTASAAAHATPVIVKFTDQLTTPTGRRWADLLVAEAHALALLQAQGEAHAAPRLLDAGGRRFLEVPRYDRIGPHGRRGVISLRALHDAFPGPSANTWPDAAASLAALDLISPETLRAIRRRHAFGRLIGNTDMHFGNLAFWFDDTLPFRLAPAYDMLPMLWAPVPGDATPAPAFAPALPLPADREVWHEAAAWAAEFWTRLADDAQISAEFSALARAAYTTVARLRTLA